MGSIFYVGASIQGAIDGVLPWTTCGDFSNENCTLLDPVNVTDSDNATKKEGFLGLQRCVPNEGIVENCTYLETPATQYWEKYVLEITPEIPELGDLGGFSYGLPLCLAASWLVVFLCLMKGVKSSGKVVYFTATFPYLILFALLIRGVTLPGAGEGLEYLFIPKWEQLLVFQVWRNAAEQMFFSLGISWGGLMMFGSYNKFHDKINIDAAVVSSLLSSLLVKYSPFWDFCQRNLEYPSKLLLKKD